MHLLAYYCIQKSFKYVYLSYKLYSYYAKQKVIRIIRTHIFSSNFNSGTVKNTKLTMKLSLSNKELQSNLHITHRSKYPTHRSIMKWKGLNERWTVSELEHVKRIVLSALFYAEWTHIFDNRQLIKFLCYSYASVTFYKKHLGIEKLVVWYEKKC